MQHHHASRVPWGECNQISHVMEEIKAPHNFVYSEPGSLGFFQPDREISRKHVVFKERLLYGKLKRVIKSVCQSVGETSKGLNLHVWMSERGGRGGGAVRESKHRLVIPGPSEPTTDGSAGTSLPGLRQTAVIYIDKAVRGELASHVVMDANLGGGRMQERERNRSAGEREELCRRFQIYALGAEKYRART